MNIDTVLTHPCWLCDNMLPDGVWICPSCQAELDADNNGVTVSVKSGESVDIAPKTWYTEQVNENVPRGAANTQEPSSERPLKHD